MKSYSIKQHYSYDPCDFNSLDIAKLTMDSEGEIIKIETLSPDFDDEKTRFAIDEEITENQKLIARHYASNGGAWGFTTSWVIQDGKVIKEDDSWDEEYESDWEWKGK